MIKTEGTSWLVAVGWGCATVIVSVLVTEGALFLNGEPSERRNYIGSLAAGFLVAVLIRSDYIIPHGQSLGTVVIVTLVGVAAYLRYRSQSFW